MKTLKIFLAILLSCIITTLSATIQITSTQCICGENGEGSIEIEATGDAGPFTFEWVGPEGVIPEATDQNLTGITEAGFYSVIVTNAYGCQTSLGPVEITMCPGIDQLIFESTPTCENETDGSITLSVLGGVAPLTYEWSNGATTANLYAISGGTYSVTVTDANGCTATGEEMVTEYLIPQIDADITLSSCENMADGAISLNINSAIPYVIDWSNGATTATLTDLTGGDYTVIVTDDNGCSVIETYSTLPTEPQAEMPYIKKVEVFAAGGGLEDLIYRGEWIVGADGKICFSGGMEDIPEPLFGEIEMGLKSFRINAYSSEELSSLNLTIPDVIEIDLIYDTDHWFLSISQGYVGNYLISNGVLNAELIFSGNDFLIPPTGLLDLRLVSMDLQNCVQVPELMPDCSWIPVYPMGQDDVHLLEWGCPDLDLDAEAISSTSGNCDGGILVSFDSENTPYTFTVTNNGNVISTSGNSPSYNFSGLCPGTYTVTASDSESCSESTQVTISDCAGIIIGAPIITNATDCDAGDGSIDFSSIEPSGGTAPYSFQWSSGETGKIIENLSSGYYSVTITDANGCSLESNYTVGYETNGGAVFEVSNLEISDDENGDCTGSVSVDLDYNGYNDVRYELTGSGVYLSTFIDSPAPSYAYTFDNLCEGEYTLKIKQYKSGLYCLIEIPVTINGCINFTLSGNPAIIKPTSCDSNDGSIVYSEPNPIGGTPPYEWAWSTGSNAAYQISGLSPDIYSLTITDANGCSFEKTFDLTIPGDLSFVEVIHITPSSGDCNGSIEISGIPGVTLHVVGAFYSSTVVMDGISNTFSDLCGDLYFITATDINGCQYILQVEVVDCPDIIIPKPKIASPSTCTSSDGVIQFFTGPSGGVAPYSWNWIPDVGNDGYLANLSPGVYYLTITDANGCTIEASYQLIDESTPQIIYGATPACEGVANGSIIAYGVSEGGSYTYTYEWEDGSTGEELENLEAGTYCLTLTEVETGCSNTDCMTVDEIPSTGTFEVGNFTSTPSCPNQITGAISLNIVGGNPPYKVYWNNGMEGESINDLPGGFYQATIFDYCGRQINFNVLVDIYPEMGLGVTPIPGCRGEGILDLGIHAGAPPISYIWSNGATTQDVGSLGEGEALCVTVTDGNGCQEIICGVAENYPTINISLEVETSCSDGIVTQNVVANVSGGTGPFTYLWNNGATTNVLGSVSTGEYDVTITSVNGCEEFSRVTVEPCLGAEITVIDKGVGKTSASGGTPPYFYEWSGPNGFSYSAYSYYVPGYWDLEQGEYSLTVTDACCNTNTFTIFQNFCEGFEVEIGFADPCGGIELPPQDASYAFISNLIIPDHFDTDALYDVTWYKNGVEKEQGTTTINSSAPEEGLWFNTVSLNVLEVPNGDVNPGPNEFPPYHIYSISIKYLGSGEACNTGDDIWLYNSNNNIDKWFARDDLTDSENHDFIITGQYDFGEPHFLAVTRKSSCPSCIGGGYGPSGCHDQDDITTFILEYEFDPSNADNPCTGGGLIYTDAQHQFSKVVPPNGISKLVTSVNKCGCLFPEGIIYAPDTPGSQTDYPPFYVEFDCSPEEIENSEYYDCSDMYLDCFLGCSEEFIGMTDDYSQCLYEVTCLDDNEVIDEIQEESTICYRSIFDDFSGETFYIYYYYCECSSNPTGFVSMGETHDNPGDYSECPCDFDEAFAPDPEESMAIPVNPDTQEEAILTQERNLVRQRKNEAFEVKYYPNPFSDVLNFEIKAKEAGNLNVKLVNIFGQEVLGNRFGIQKGDNRIELKELQIIPDGIYFVLLEDENGETLMFKLMHSAY